MASKWIHRVTAGILGVCSVLGAARADELRFTPVKDNTLYQDSADTPSNGDGPTLYVGRNAQSNSRRALLAFDLSFIPPGSTITQATLTMTVTRSRGGGAFSLHRVSADWGEGDSNAGTPGGNGTDASPGDATWRHRFFPNVLWTTPGGDYVAAASASSTVGDLGTYSWSAAGMVADIQQWVNNPSTNFGWLMRGAETTNSQTKQLESRESTDIPARPMLRVTFTPPATTGACCLDDGRCAVTTSAGCATLGGDFQGAGVRCDSGVCPMPTGACCIPNGMCEILTQAACELTKGDYQGDNMPCGVIRCPLVLTPFVDQLPIPPIATPETGTAGGTASYVMPITQFQTQIHRDLPPTTVWGVAGTYPGPTIEASEGHPVTVTWMNELRDEEGFYLTKHFLEVDRCLNGPHEMGDTPRTVIHLHGGMVEPESDGDPRRTLMPGELDVYYYPNHQDPCTLWYHDHAMGMTRLNVYMGIAGMYLIRNPAEAALNLPSGEFEIPLVIQDRSFNPDGSMYYPEMWEDHFFGDTIVVNGKAWPSLTVKRGKYRFRMLNASNSRTYTLSLSNGAPMWVVGTDQGLLSAPVTVTSATIAPGERLDVVMDFAAYQGGSQVVLKNSAPIHFPGIPTDGVIPDVMRFVVINSQGHTAAVPAALKSVPRIPAAEARVGRSFDLRLLPDNCHGSAWLINGLRYDDIVETPRLGSTEIWTFTNRSSVMHPMHMHLVRFQILDRQPFQIVDGRVTPTGPRVAPTAIDAGWKDTVKAQASEITRVIARFEGFTGYYPYHCHILEHEDNEMMRQMLVLPECPCDRNNDGHVDSNDFFVFVNMFFGGNADFNKDGTTSSQDFFDFLNCFFGGCLEG